MDQQSPESAPNATPSETSLVEQNKLILSHEALKDTGVLLRKVAIPPFLFIRLEP
jgi:hypothetical protein